MTHVSRRAVAIAAVGLAGLGLALYLGNVFASHYVSVTNDTDVAIDWQCSWSDLHLDPGATGSVRIMDHPDQDFGCKTGPTSNEVTCPDLGWMTADQHITVTEWIRRFPCP